MIRGAELPAAIVFGSIGTITETSEMQRAAFNQAFSEAGLGWHWDREAYRDMLRHAGGRKRILRYAKEQGADVDAAALHGRKTELFDAAIRERGLRWRDGVVDVLDWADREAIPVALASTTLRENVDAVLDALPNAANRFRVVADSGAVRRPKPEPDVYLFVCDELGVDPAACVGIEDTGVNLAAPLAAGMRAIAFPGANALAQDYAGADTVVDRLTPELFTPAARR